MVEADKNESAAADGTTGATDDAKQHDVQYDDDTTKTGVSNQEFARMR